jgi:hypothetical protein
MESSRVVLVGGAAQDARADGAAGVSRAANVSCWRVTNIFKNKIKGKICAVRIIMQWASNPNFNSDPLVPDPTKARDSHHNAMGQQSQF